MQYRGCNMETPLVNQLGARIEPLKARHVVTKLDLTIPLLSLWCIDIDSSI